MKIKKYLLVILSILLILLVFVSSASAADSNGTDILSIDESTNNEKLALDYSPDTTGESNDTNIIENNENNLLSADNDESGNVLGEGTGTFADLQTEISTALSSGDYVKLTKDTYIYAGSGSQIEIGKSCTIDGNGATIDMAGSNIRAFYVTAESGVTIKNLTIKNANYNGFGGAIYFSQSGTVENCNFTNNTVTDGSGSAIWMSSGSVINCNFTANQATTGVGGAIYFNSNGNVTNCNFNANKAYHYGGAIYFDNGGSITNCNFTNNTANDGGAIRMFSGSSVTNCNFTNNTANGGGGAIRMVSGSVTNCNFADNSASQGGAILSVKWWGVTADTCIFKTDSDTTFNTYNLPPTLNIDNFTSFYGSREKLTFDLKTNSGIPVTNGNISISVYFKNNDSWVGNYSCLSGEGWIPDLPVGFYCAIFDTEYAEFQPINRTVTIMPNNTFWALNYTINANDNSVINLSTDYYFDSEYDSEFVNGVVINRPLTINGNGHTIDALQKARIFNINAINVVLNNITFTNANTSGNGGAIYFSSSGTVENCNFTNNTAIFGGAILFAGEGSVTNCNFTNNQASRGGAVYFHWGGTVTNCNFTNNTATNGDGGAIWMSSGSVTNCNFTANQASRGGAVYFWDEGTVTNCNFTNNKADDGGAVYFLGEGTVTNCNFTNNHAEYDGGAVYFLKSGNVTNCNFTGNNATTGSAIYFYKLYSSDTITISNSTFLNNRANAEALEVTKNDNNITITFKGNDNLLNAIYSNGKVTFTNVTYWSAKGINNTGNFAIKPSRSKNEAGQNITLEIYDSNDNLVDNVTLVTDDNGQVTYDFIKLSNGNYTYKAYHSEDCYYTYVENPGTYTLNIGDFNRLQKYINGADANSVLTLDRNYTFTIGLDENLTKGIVIDKPLTINGNGYTIDALQKTRIFMVTASSINITGLTIKNGKANVGGAIYVENDISNSNINASFINNIATMGGANYFYSSVSGSTIAGTYSNNNATMNGGVNHFNWVVSGSTIAGTYSNNNAEDKGGANYFLSPVSNSTIAGTYSNNNAEGKGGANYFLSPVSGSTIAGTYSNNNATNGGANHFWDPVSNSTIAGTYSNNNATDDGGANYFNGEVSGSTITGTYSNNNATDDGGANYFDSGVLNSTITGTYSGNNAGGYGGANRFDGEVSGLTITGTYIGNNATVGGANRFASDVSGSTINGTYIGNNATSGGGANFFSGKVSGSNITGTYINNTSPNYAIIYIELYSTDAVINYAIFLNNKCNYEIYAVGGVVVKDCWFGNNASNFMNKPNNHNVKMDNWLFLNATADYNSLLILDSSNIIFKLNSTNGTDVFVFDNSKLPPVNLTLTATNGDVENTTTLDNIVKYMATEKGKGSVTAKIENAQYTIYFDNSLRNVNLSASAENITYLENEILTLTYNNTATGKVNITLKSKNYIKTIERDINQTFTITDLPAGDYDVIIEYFGDNVFSNATAYANFTVKKITTEVILDNETIDLFVDEEYKITYTLKPENALGNISFSSDDSSIVSVNSVSGDIVAKAEGSAIITISFSGSENYTASNATITVTVNLKDASVSVNNKTLNLLVDDNFTIVATTVPEGVNVTFVQDDSGVYIVDENGVVTALKNGTGSVLVKVGGDGIYAKNSTIVNVTVSKVPTEISVLNDTLDLKVDGVVETGATLTPADAGNLTYTVSNPSIVKVENGKITALKEGNATITVSFAENKKYLAAENKTINVTVSLNDASVSVNNDTLDLLVDDKFNLIATTEPKDLTVNYTSSNPSVVTVDNEGNVVAVSEGTATITVSVGGDGVYVENSTTVTVTVSKVPTEISVNPASLDLLVGNERSITAILTPAEAGNVTFTSSDKNIVTVDNQGNVIAIGEGNATITVSFEGNNKYAAADNITVTVTVNKVPTEINIKNDTLKLEVKDDISTGATLTPADAGNVTYTISNSSIVKVEDGKIIALAEGEAVITVSFAGDNKYAAAENKTISVTVKLKDASVSVENATLDILIGDNDTIIAFTTPEGLNVTYVPDDSGVYSIENGVVTALKEGTATITVKVGGDGIYAENTTTVTVSVSKVPTEITVNPASLDLFVGDETVIVATLTPADAGNVTFTSSDENIIIVDDQGNVIANGKGQAIITVSFKGDNKYAASENKTITVVVSLNDASVTVDNDTLDLKVDETYAINATKNPDTILLDITYTSSDETVATVDEKGVVTAVGEGSAIITVSVGDGEIYAENSTNITVTVSKVPTEITVLNDTIVLEVNDEVSAGATLTPGDAGNLTYTSSNSSVVKVEDGKIIALAEGNATTTVSFKGDNKYAAAENKTISVTVNLKKASIIAEPDSLELIIGEDGSIYVTTNPEDLDYIFTSSDESVVTVQSKNRVGKVLAVGEGNATITVTINEEAYVKNSTTVNIAVNRNDTLTVTAQNLTKYYKDPQKFTVTVTDTKGQAVSNKTVEITINGITYTRTTDENGTAKLNINLDSGEYPVSVNVDDITVNSTVTVKSTIDASDVVKIFRNDTQYNAKFIDSNANILANIQVSFNINGIIYNRTTDGNGTAKLNINLDAGDYIITATNPVTGEMKSDTITVISLIESDDLTKYYRNASQFVVRIHSADGGYVGAGEEIKFNINGVFYTRTTNETGHAKLNINLGQGNYTITTYYKDCSQGNNIEVLPILSANDLVMKYMDGSQFKAKLVDGQGKAYPKQTIKFNINGVIYNGKTDSDGVAKLNINLMAGQYIITSSYNDFNIANKITIRG